MSSDLRYSVATQRPSGLKISVCMATYNGVRFVRQQVETILPQLRDTDELIIVDDASTDDTVRILREFQDNRIRIEQNSQNIGVVSTFERALRCASGDLIFLADQDDLWRKDKVASIEREFQLHPDIVIVISDAAIIDSDGRVVGKWSERLAFSSALTTNLIRNRYVGCLMAFRRELLNRCLPFPPKIPMHDSWLGLMGHFHGRTQLIPQCLVSYRRHSGTVTTGKHAGFFTMLRWRLTLIRHLILRTKSGMNRTHREG